jgi:predicted GIY-YIG superfamily endonuclease
MFGGLIDPEWFDRDREEENDALPESDQAAEPMVSIYVLIDPRDDRVKYVGQTRDPKSRMWNHISNRARLPFVQELYTEGLRPRLTVVQQCALEIADEREAWWIQHYRTLGEPLVNRTNGGRGVPGWVHPEDARVKIRMANSRRVYTPDQMREIGAKISRALTGKKRSREQCEAMRGRVVSAEARRKLRESRLGTTMSPESRAKLSASKRGQPAHNKGLPMSPAQKIVLSRANRVLSDENVAEIRALIRTGEISQAAIARKFGVCEATITRVKRQDYVQEDRHAILASH